MNLIRVGVVGSRSRDKPEDKALIKQVLVRQLKQGKTLHLVSGGCSRGADKFCENLAEELHLGLSIHYPDLSDCGSDVPRWVYAQKAFARNSKIVHEADLLIVCWDGRSGGTADTIKKAEEKGIPIIYL